MDIHNTALQAAILPGAVVALVVALIGAVAAAFLFLRAGSKVGRRGWLRTLRAHVNFERFHLASILKFLYVFCVLYSAVTGISALFTGAALGGVVWLVLVPVGLRAVFEQIMVLLSIREEAREANDLLRRMQGLPPKNAAQPVAQPQAQAQQQPRPQQADPRYPARPAGYPSQPNAGYGGYPAAGRQPAARPADYGMTQRYAPIRRDAYGSGYDAQPYAPPSGMVRPTPADGTGRFSALPKREDIDRS